MDLNRRDLLKSGAAGFLIGFLFRGRNGKLSEQPEVTNQPPTAVTITTMPQRTFHPERLVIAGIVVGKRLVPEKKLVPCTVCDGQFNDDVYDDEHYCEECGNLGDKFVETGQMVERDVTVVPWSIESLTIGPNTQFGGEAVPGDVFSADAHDNYLRLDTASEGQEIQIVVRYTGDKPDGEVFHGALIGTSIGQDGVPRRSILPISSTQKIVA